MLKSPFDKVIVRPPRYRERRCHGVQSCLRAKPAGLSAFLEVPDETETCEAKAEQRERGGDRDGRSRRR